MAEEDTGKLALVFAKQFYKHALRTIAYAVAAFSLIGGLAVTLTFRGGDIDPAYATVSFLSWGGLAAAIVFAVRKPPF